jgi:hypothetical protein
MLASMLHQTSCNTYVTLGCLLFRQVATEADLGFADAYINGYFSFADHREGLLNLLLVKN